MSCSGLENYHNNNSEPVLKGNHDEQQHKNMQGRLIVYSPLNRSNSAKQKPSQSVKFKLSEEKEI